MKKKLVAIIIAGAMLITPATAAKGMSWNYKIGGKNLYADVLIVNKVDYAYNKVWLKNRTTGYKYWFTGCEDWEVGDKAACIMDTRGTERVKDDKVRSAKYVR